MEQSIVQWNCRGYSSNFEELKYLIKEKSPECLCLQETFHGANPPLPPRGYSAICAPQVLVPPPGTRPSRGVLTLIRNNAPFYSINIRSELEVVAIRMKLRKEITICNIYVSPQEVISGPQLLNLTRQLPTPFLILGDLNARNSIWGDCQINQYGRIIEDLISNNNISVLNSGEATHFHIQTGVLSCIDLSLCSPELLLDLDWTVCDDLMGSDHFPIIISENSSTQHNSTPRFNLNKADWKLFHDLTVVTEDEYIEENPDIDELVDKFNSLVLNAASAAIPRTSTNFKYIPVPWWNRECQRTHKDRKRAQQRYQRTRTIADKIALNRASAIARRVKRTARRKSWQEFVSSINENTPDGKILEEN